MSLHARVPVCVYRACINGCGVLNQWSEGMKKFRNCVWFKNSDNVYDRLSFFSCWFSLKFPDVILKFTIAVLKAENNFRYVLTCLST